MIQYTIYIIDDDEIIRTGICLSLESEYSIRAFATAESALDAMPSNPPDLILLDIGLPGMDGIKALHHIRDKYPDILVIMITAYEDVKTVISAMKLGAYDYVVKPLVMDGLEITIRNALSTIRLRKEVQNLQETYLAENIPCFVAESNALHDVLKFIGMVAKSPDTPILILGETGTGKEPIASAIHYRSPNFKGSFITVNCAAIPKNLIESELFGYEKGAFSGASASGKKGLIEAAGGGTLFLDEVGDLSLEAQAKLLRFLEEGEFYRVGGTTKLQVHTRVVSATNKDLFALIDKGLFRQDLYFRLAVIVVTIPSLNERPDDILPLANHFLLHFSDKFGRTFNNFSDEAIGALTAHHWTGNVRELKNMIERAVLIAQEPSIEKKDFGIPETNTFNQNNFSFPPLTETGVDISSIENTLEKHYILEALRISKGNESKAAKLLNLNHHTFRYRRKNLS
jgi:DNA-binding NtrC family response regulator